MNAGAGITDCANPVKPVFDRVAKKLCIVDTIVVWASNNREDGLDE